MTDRLISAGPKLADETTIDWAIRSKRLAVYAGQPAVYGQMDIFIQTARQRAEVLDHVLIFGSPGLGKTTMAHIVANEISVMLRQTSGLMLERYHQISQMRP